MKLIILPTSLAFLCFSFLSMNLFSQNEYFSNNVSWGVEHGAQGPWYGNYDRVKYSVQGDTVIENTLYKKIYEAGIYISYQSTSPENPWQQNTYSETTINNPLPRLIVRSQGMRMYKWNTQNQIEELLYDFDVAVGDTMYIHPEMFFYPIVVESVDSILIAGEYRRIIEVVSTELEEIICPTFIEGIGNLKAHLDGITFVDVSDIKSNLICYSYNDEYFQIDFNYELMPSSEECEYVVGIEEIVDYSKLRLYPNPIDGNGSIQISGIDKSENILITFFDLTGKCIHSVKTFCSGNLITLNNLRFPAGYYQVQVQFDNKRTANFKIVVN
jgi:hypothetical protein